MKTLFLRILPYLISVIVGVALYIYTVSIKDGNLSNMLMNVCAGLFSIPVIFIGYEVVRDACTKKINSSLSYHLRFEINHEIIRLLSILSNMVGINLSEEGVDELLSRSQPNQSDTFVYSTDLSKELDDIKKQIEGVIHGSKHMDVLSNDQIHAIFGIAKGLGVLSRYITANVKESVIKNATDELFQATKLWVESEEDDAFITHNSFKLMA